MSLSPQGFLATGFDAVAPALSDDGSFGVAASDTTAPSPSPPIMHRKVPSTPPLEPRKLLLSPRISKTKSTPSLLLAASSISSEGKSLGLAPAALSTMGAMEALSIDSAMPAMPATHLSKPDAKVRVFRVADVLPQLSTVDDFSISSFRGLAEG